MKLILLAVTFLGVLCAQEKVKMVGQSLQGTWISQLSDASGAVSLFELGTFSPDGSYSGANVNPTHTEHKGVWLRIGDRKFLVTVMFFTRDDKQVFNGIVKAKIYITIAEDLMSYESQAERTLMDTSGKVLNVLTGLSGRSVRMEAEFPEAAPPQ